MKWLNRCLCLLWVWLPAVGMAQVLTPETWPKPTVGDTLRVKPADAWLWRISHSAYDHLSYVYAIMPELPAEQFRLPTQLRLLARGQQKLVMGIDPSKPPRDLIHAVEVPLDSTLEVLLTENDYQALKTWVQDSLSSLSYLKLQKRYPPSVLARQFMQDYCLDRVDGPPSVMVEYQVKKVLDLPLEVVGTGWTRVAWLDVYSYADQTWQLMHVFRDRAAQCEIYQAMIRAYLAQDLDRVWLLSQSAPDMGYHFGGLLEARNHAWMQFLRLHLPLENLVLVVNAAQLPGEYGLLHQLRQAGYEVTPVYLDPTMHR